jgi:hypothetical protein
VITPPGTSLDEIAVLKLHNGYPGRECTDNLMHGNGMPQMVQNDSVEWGIPDEFATYYVSMWNTLLLPFVCHGPIHVHSGSGDTLLLHNISSIAEVLESLNGSIK